MKEYLENRIKELKHQRDCFAFNPYLTDECLRISKVIEELEKALEFLERKITLEWGMLIPKGEVGEDDKLPYVKFDSSNDLNP